MARSAVVVSAAQPSIAVVDSSRWVSTPTAAAPSCDSRRSADPCDDDAVLEQAALHAALCLDQVGPRASRASVMPARPSVWSATQAFVAGLNQLNVYCPVVAARRVVIRALIVADEEMVIAARREWSHRAVTRSGCPWAGRPPRRSYCPRSSRRGNDSETSCSCAPRSSRGAAGAQSTSSMTLSSLNRRFRRPARDSCRAHRAATR